MKQKSCTGANLLKFISNLLTIQDLTLAKKKCDQKIFKNMQRPRKQNEFLIKR